MRKSVNGKRRSGLTGESVITLPDSVKNVKNWKKSENRQKNTIFNLFLLFFHFFIFMVVGAEVGRSYKMACQSFYCNFAHPTIEGPTLCYLVPRSLDGWLRS